MSLLILLLTVLVGALIGSGIALVIGQAQGLNLMTLMNNLSQDPPLRVRNYLRSANLVSHIFTFAIPALVVAYFFYRPQWLAFLRLLGSPAPPSIFLFAIGFIAASFPLAQFTYWLNQQLPLPQNLLEMEASAEQMLRTVLTMKSPTELFFNLLLIGVIPALGEELLFRGVLQQQLEKWFRNGHLAIWVTALIFSAVHLQFAGFIPRFLLGAILGYLFYWSRNLWVPILAHLVFNGGQVMAQYFYGEELDAMQFEETASANWWSTLLGLGLMVLFAKPLIDYRKAKTTPPEL